MSKYIKYRSFNDAVLKAASSAAATGKGVVFRTFADEKRFDDFLSYRDLISKAASLASLISQEHRAGERALLMCPTGIDYVIGFMASLFSGIVVIPVYPPKKYRNNWERLNSIVEDAEPSLLFTVGGDRDLYIEHFDRLEKQGIKVLLLDKLETKPLNGYDRFIGGLDDLAYLQYTSGSTNAPKGLRVTHRNILHNMEATRESLRLPKEKIFVSWLPFYHDMGLVGTLLQALYFSADYIFMSPFDFVKNPFEWLRAISDYKATISWAPNFAYDLCVDKVSEDQAGSLDLSAWRVAANMAEPVRGDTLKRFSNKFSVSGFSPENLCPAYGMAETTLTITASPANDKPVFIDVSAESFTQGKVVLYEEALHGGKKITLAGSGKVAADQRVIVVNPDSGELLTDKQVGEIWVSGESVTDGYYNRGSFDAGAFNGSCKQYDGQVFLKTGDLGFFDSGELFVTGRKKDLIIIRGENHYPQDVELTVQKCHSLFRKGCIAAFRIEENQIDKLVVVAEVRKATISMREKNSLISAAKSAVLKEYGISLHHLVLLPPGSYLRTSSGKVQRSLSHKKYLNGELTTVDVAVGSRETLVNGEKAASAVATVDWLKAMLAGLLNIPVNTLNSDAPMADFGLDSLTATQFSELISRRLGRTVPLEVAYDYPTLSLLADYLAEIDTPRGDCPPSQSVVDLNEDTAIIGMACRFPRAESIDQFWKLILAGGDGISDIGKSRWALNAHELQGEFSALTKGGFLKDIARFDCGFFSITPREAECMDPQQRLLLELCHQALEDAGLSQEMVNGTRAGVYIGISDADYARQQLKLGVDKASYAGTGSALSIAANRISYYWNLKGPSVAIDTACSSSLAALHNACKDLSLGEVDMAIVGAVNLLVSPDISTVYKKANMLSPDSLCKVFDDNANGYVRGEGCGVVILKRKKAAASAGDPVYALIKGSAVMQDGKSNGLTAPVGPAQEATIRRALAKAKLAPADLTYVEAHGTGTALGDPIEVSALSSVFCADKTRSTPLLVGSVKANIGHLESAAGMAGLIKVALSLKHQLLPPQIHLRKPSTKIPWNQNGITVVPTEPLTWPVAQAPRRAGVSSFGFGGTLAHAILEQAPPHERPAAQYPPREPAVLCISAKSPAALAALRERYLTFLQETPEPAIGDLCYTAAVGRSHFPYRLAVTGTTAVQLHDALSQAELPTAPASSPKVAWLCSGQGSQYAGMGHQLYQQEPVFRAEIDRCADLLADELDLPLTTLLWGEAGDRLDETCYTQ
ncbi:AMP-binding protein, partial [Exilibacterium tricleocarpae]